MYVILVYDICKDGNGHFILVSFPHIKTHLYTIYVKMETDKKDGTGYLSYVSRILYIFKNLFLKEKYPMQTYLSLKDQLKRK